MVNIGVETRRGGTADETSTPLDQSGRFDALRLPNAATKRDNAQNVPLATILPRLDSDSFAEREAATREVAQQVQYRPEVERLLFRSNEDALSLEARVRLQRALSTMWSDSPELRSLTALEAAFEGWSSVTIGKAPSHRLQSQQIIERIGSSIERCATADYEVSVAALRSLGARAEVCQGEEHFLRSCLDALREAPSAPTSVNPEQTLLLVANELSRAVRDGGDDPERLRLRVAAFSVCARRHGVEPTEIGALGPEEASKMYREVASMLGALRTADRLERANHDTVLIQPLCDAIAAGDFDKAMKLAEKMHSVNCDLDAIDRDAGRAAR